MGVNLRGRSFLKLLDFTSEEIRYLLDLSKAVSYTHLIIFNEKNKGELGQDKYLINGFQRATMPLDEDVFYKVIKLINLNNYTNINKYEEIIDIKNLGNSITGIELLNEFYANTNIEQKEKLVKVIERGKIANKIKEYIQYKLSLIHIYYM